MTFRTNDAVIRTICKSCAVTGKSSEVSPTYFPCRDTRLANQSAGKSLARKCTRSPAVCLLFLDRIVDFLLLENTF